MNENFSRIFDSPCLACQLLCISLKAWSFLCLNNYYFTRLLLTLLVNKVSAQKILINLQ